MYVVHCVFLILNTGYQNGCGQTCLMAQIEEKNNMTLRIGANYVRMATANDEELVHRKICTLYRGDKNELSVSLNRRIDGSDVGSGICRARFRWLCNESGTCMLQFKRGVEAVRTTFTHARFTYLYLRL